MTAQEQFTSTGRLGNETPFFCAYKKRSRVSHREYSLLTTDENVKLPTELTDNLPLRSLTYASLTLLSDHSPDDVATVGSYWKRVRRKTEVPEDCD